MGVGQKEEERRGTHLSRSWSELAVRVLKYMVWRELRGPGGLSTTTARENCTWLEVKITVYNSIKTHSRDMSLQKLYISWE